MSRYTDWMSGEPVEREWEAPPMDELRRAAAIVNEGIRNGRTDEEIARAVLAATPAAKGLRDEYANLSLPLGSTREAAEHERKTALYYIDRILAATPAADNPALDVDRLAEALWFEGLLDYPTPDAAKAREAAESLLSAYAGLVKHHAALTDPDPGS